MAARGAFAILMLGALADRAGAQAQPIDARVIWAHGERVYLAAADSGVFEPGVRVLLVERAAPGPIAIPGARAPIASGRIVQVVDGRLAIVQLAGDSLGSHPLERLEVLAERMPPRPALLRVGIPSPRRSNLLFACREMTFDSTLGGTPYRATRHTSHLWTLVRAAGADSDTTSRWPDTLRVRRFDDVADQEIALERGEIDLGVFWPGELSTRVREDPRWRDPPLGIRTRGVVAIVAAGDLDSLPAALPGIAELNARMFRGDLSPLPFEEIPNWTRPAPPLRYEVDASLPGRRAIERFLDREVAARTGIGWPRTVGLDYFDTTPQSIADWRGSDSIRLVFAVGCPIVCRPELRAYVEALGASAWADLPRCMRGADRR